MSENCKPHKKVFELLKNHRLLKRYTKGIHTLKEKEKDKDKEKEEEKEKEKLRKLIKQFEVSDLDESGKRKLKELKVKLKELEK